MKNPTYGYTKEFPSVDFDTAVQRTVEALKTEGFGVLTQIDVQATLKAKIGVDMPRYLILGACNPPLAHKTLSAEWGVGLLLPCNVVVRDREGGGSVVSAANPRELFRIVDNPEVAPIADEVDARIQRVMEKLQ